MDKSQKIIAALIVVFIFLLLGFTIVMNNSRNNIGNKVDTGKKLNVSTTPTPKPLITMAPSETIMITYTRPVPRVLKSKIGVEINFANFSGEKVDIAGQDDSSSALNLGIVEYGDTSKIVVFKKPGTYKYSDKLNSKLFGEIVIE